MKVPLYVALCLFGLSCSSATDGGGLEASKTSYSLVAVDGKAVPDLFSSLPGAILWEGEDGSMLAIWQGSVECGENGTAQENYGFRLSREGSALWTPIQVSVAVECEVSDSGSVRFDYLVTGDSLEATVEEEEFGCPRLSKPLPSVEALRAGVDPGSSLADFPAELAFSTPPVGEFRGSLCISR